MTATQEGLCPQNFQCICGTGPITARMMPGKPGPQPQGAKGGHSRLCGGLDDSGFGTQRVLVAGASSAHVEVPTSVEEVGPGNCDFLG